MIRHRVPSTRSPVTVLKTHLIYHMNEGNRLAIADYELAIEVLEAVGIH